MLLMIILPVTLLLNFLIVFNCVLTRQSISTFPLDNIRESIMLMPLLTGTILVVKTCFVVSESSLPGMDTIVRWIGVWLAECCLMFFLWLLLDWWSL